jgi:hypothetical protein
VQQAEVSELIQIDRMYLDRIQLRKDLIARHEDQVLAVNPPAIEAVRELYSWLVDQYLPQRYGDIFELHRQESSGNIETFLQNKVTDDIVPIDPSLQSPEDALRIIGRQVEEDFLFLLPSGPEEQLVLEAYIACFPAGFAWTMKRGKTLAEIHQPVPDYKKKLQLSMDRFLSRLEPGKFVKRLNVSLELRFEIMLKARCCDTDGGTVVHNSYGRIVRVARSPQLWRTRGGTHFGEL